MVVKHNITAMNSNRMLGLTTSSQAKSTEKLSSGYKINRAADDAAGLAISEKMRKQIRGLTQASANAQDGISAVQTAEGALNEVQDMLQRMNELSVKAANGTMSESDREAIQNEVNQLTTEIDRVSETTKFNETYLLKGDQDVSKVATYKYSDYAAANKKKAAVLDASGNDCATSGKEITVNGLKMKVEFEEGAKSADQNALAKSLVNQGINVDFSSTWDATLTTPAAVNSWKLTLNGSASTDYVAVADTTAGVFAVQDKNGNKIATITMSGGTAATAAATSQKASAVITGASATAARVEGEKAAIYDRDGNKIAENALDKYFALNDDGNAVARVDAPDAYDALGNKISLNDFVGANALVSGAKDLTGALTLTLHVGADATSNNQISVNMKSMSAKGLGVSGLKVDGTDDTNALNAIDTIKEAIQKVSDQRAELGAVQNRLEHTINNLDNVVENTTSAEAAIRDTDIATEMVQYSNNNILQQAGTSMLSQANQSNQLALSLLG